MKRKKQLSRNALARRLKETEDRLQTTIEQGRYYKFHADHTEQNRRRQADIYTQQLSELRKRLHKITDSVVNASRCSIGVHLSDYLEQRVINGRVRLCVDVNIEHITSLISSAVKDYHEELANRLADEVRRRVMTDIKLT